MFRQRGGVHYVRKISRLVPHEIRGKENEQLMFLNRDFSKNDFERVKNEDYGDIEI